MNFEKDIQSCLTALEKGGIILYPTDTVWGIGCDATNPEAVEKIFALKKRPDQKSMIILLADEKAVLQHVANPDLSVFEYLNTVMKPVTVIYEGGIGIAQNLVAKDGSVAIRIVKDEFCRHLIRRFRKPIVSTSANISGQAFSQDFKSIQEEIKKGVDYIVQYRQDEKIQSMPSSIIKWVKGKPEIIRS